MIKSSDILKEGAELISRKLTTDQIEGLQRLLREANPDDTDCRNNALTDEEWTRQWAILNRPMSI